MRSFSVPSMPRWLLRIPLSRSAPIPLPPASSLRSVLSIPLKNLILTSLDALGASTPAQSPTANPGVAANHPAATIPDLLVLLIPLVHFVGAKEHGVLRPSS